jgi:4-hydroxy-2-oxoglutarate aldolase
VERAKLELGGVLIPAVTPFQAGSGDLDLPGFRGNLRHWLATGIRGVVLGGSTGEAVLLDEEERTRLLEAAREMVPEDRLMVAGTGGESTRITLRRTQRAAEAGADAVLVQPPAFYRGQMTPAVLRDHYRALADEASIPVILYQVPLRFSTLEFPTGLVAELSEHPNIVGIKDSRGDLSKLGDLLDQVRPGFQVLVGTGAKLYASLEMGAAGGILGVANIVPVESAEIVAAFRGGRTEDAGRIQERVAPLHDGVVGGFGVPGVKAALDLLGLTGGPPRSPLPSLDEAGLRKVRQLLEEAALAPFRNPEAAGGR